MTHVTSFPRMKNRLPLMIQKVKRIDRNELTIAKEYSHLLRKSEAIFMLRVEF